jgi:hypothetical protein
MSGMVRNKSTLRRMGFRMVVPGPVLPRGYRIVVLTLSLVAVALFLLIALRILTGLAYYVGSLVAFALLFSCAVIQFRFRRV